MAKKSDSVTHFFGGTDPAAADELNVSLDTPDAEEDASLDGEIAVDVYQDSTHVVVISPIAGVRPDKIEISADDDAITISGERGAEHLQQENDVITQEIYWGSFSRTVALPVPCLVDKAVASFKHGVLTVRIPKVSAKTRKRVIKVKAAE